MVRKTTLQRTWESLWGVDRRSPVITCGAGEPYSLGRRCVAAIFGIQLPEKGLGSDSAAGGHLRIGNGDSHHRASFEQAASHEFVRPRFIVSPVDFVKPSRETDPWSGSTTGMGATNELRRGHRSFGLVAASLALLLGVSLAATLSGSSGGPVSSQPPPLTGAVQETRSPTVPVPVPRAYLSDLEPSIGRWDRQWGSDSQGVTVGPWGPATVVADLQGACAKSGESVTYDLSRENYQRLFAVASVEGTYARPSPDIVLDVIADRQLIFSTQLTYGISELIEVPLGGAGVLAIRWTATSNEYCQAGGYLVLSNAQLH